MKRRTFIALTGAAFAASGLRSRAYAKSSGTTFLVAHGAWSAGWAWKKMHPLMRSAGHQLYTPTYTGLGEREHLATPAIDLDVHIQDMLGVIKCEQLRDFVLIGHSYGGAVATAVADRVPELVRKLVYLDAFVPTDGQSVMDLIPPAGAARMRAATQAADGWRLPPNPIPSDTSAEDTQWIHSLRMPQPIKTFETPVRLQHGDTKIPRAYIYCKRATPDDTFRQFATRAQRQGWDYREIDASHSPHVTAPDALMALLQAIS
ncbi:MAG TPA: alpha/beta hydrolase [Steroidobacteraceae bacterium]|nr:alpha/beta hydrolase [Steroidobacteraceae bacterium]